MNLFGGKPNPRPYVVEMDYPDGTTIEVKVEAYDAMEATVAAIFRADKEHGEKGVRKITDVRPDVDRLRESVMEDNTVRRILEGAEGK